MISPLLFVHSTALASTCPSWIRVVNRYINVYVYTTILENMDFFLCEQ